METIKYIFTWWYQTNSLNHDMGNGMVVAIYVMVILGVLSYLIGSLLGEFKDNEGGIFLGLLAILFCMVLGTLILAAGGPVFIIVGVVIGVGFLLEKVGDFYRTSVKTKESKRTEALADLISSDPAFKAQYEALMKDTPKI